MVERLRQVLLRQASGEGADVVVHAGGRVVADDDDSSIGVELEEVDSVGQAGGEIVAAKPVSRGSSCVLGMTLAR